MDLPSDLIDLLAEFADAEVEYLLIGGLAVAIHGVPRFTKDADLWISPAPVNLSRVKDALRRFGAPARTVAAVDEAEGLDVVWMGLPPARIDLVKQVPAGDWDAAWASRCEVSAGGQTILVVGRDELIRLKRASGREQDLLDVAALTQVTSP
jgi:hypothetical protein